MDAGAAAPDAGAGTALAKRRGDLRAPVPERGEMARELRHGVVLVAFSGSLVAGVLSAVGAGVLGL